MKGAEVKGRRVRLFLRLTTEVNNRLRILMRYHGELSEYIDQALLSFDLRSIDLIPVGVGRRTRGMTAVISGIANTRLRSAARRRGCTVTELANSALHKWLGEREAL
jgi:hypothetical protein